MQVSSQKPLFSIQILIHVQLEMNGTQEQDLE